MAEQVKIKFVPDDGRDVAVQDIHVATATKVADGVYTDLVWLDGFESPKGVEFKSIPGIHKIEEV